MSNGITYINYRFRVKNSGISCLALILSLNNQRMTIQQAKKWFKVLRYKK